MYESTITNQRGWGGWVDTHVYRVTAHFPVPHYDVPTRNTCNIRFYYQHFCTHKIRVYLFYYRLFKSFAYFSHFINRYRSLSPRSLRSSLPSYILLYIFCYDNSCSLKSLKNPFSFAFNQCDSSMFLSLRNIYDGTRDDVLTIE